jgi:hypothetical protein
LPGHKSYQGEKDAIDTMDNNFVGSVGSGVERVCPAIRQRASHRLGLCAGDVETDSAADVSFTGFYN